MFKPALIFILFIFITSCSAEYVCEEEWITQDPDLTKGPHELAVYRGMNAKKNAQDQCPLTTTQDTTASGYPITRRLYHYKK